MPFLSQLFVFACFSSILAQAHAQPSILSQLQEAQQSLVVIRATNFDVAQAAVRSAAVDPKTGRIIIARRLAVPTYDRQGAGTIIHRSGIIITNAHTVHKANTIQIALPDRSVHPASVIRIVKDLDLALLKIQYNHSLPAISLADSNAVRLGQEVFTIGNSAFLKNTMTGGQIIGIGVNRRLQHAGRQRTDLIQTSFNLYQGDSGGPLFDRDGRLIGVLTADEAASDHSSFAIPSNKIKKYLLEYLNRSEKK
ncbi:MAG: S1C family serine protease [Candidatus Omnitrophota bacterium]